VEEVPRRADVAARYYQLSLRQESVMSQVTPAAAERHAVVIGGSMTGLLAARVLAGHFAHVTIVERDRFPTAPGFRKGVPQSRHLHILLVRGRELLDQLFPGIVAELRADGAVDVEWPREVLWLSTVGWSERYTPGITLLSASRELIEWHVRRRVAALPGIAFREECDATGLLASPDGRAVTGVRLRPRTSDMERREEETLTADLVVDASGRDSRAPEWLAALGYPAPRETVVDSFIGYASRYYAPPADTPLDWKGMILLATVENPRGGGYMPIEGGRWLVTIAGSGRDYPPTDEAGFLAFARGLRSPMLYETLRRAEPLSPIVGYRRMENRLLHYERLPRRPERFVVLGDAACAFNPAYGQGMTVAARSALVLDRCLRGQRGTDLTGLAERFQRALAHSNALPWLMATGEDLRFPQTSGPRPGPAARLLQRYLDRVIRASTDTPVVGRSFLRVAHLVASPATLFRPRVLLPSLAARGAHGLPDPPTATPLQGTREERASAEESVRSAQSAKRESP
jgi:2-polyprenyl-6-methoxyphenol hydroxylase-like FAD-dependent oxidoreductase